MKLENILIKDKDTMSVCITDFGLGSSSSDLELLMMKTGSPGYCDPVVLSGGLCSFKSDIFSLGCIFYMLITGQSLFKGSSFKEIAMNNRFQNTTDIINDTC